MFPLSSQIADRNEQKVNVREKQAYAEGRKEGGVGGGGDGWCAKTFILTSKRYDNSS